MSWMLIEGEKPFVQFDNKISVMQAQTLCDSKRWGDAKKTDV